MQNSNQLQSGNPSNAVMDEWVKICDTCGDIGDHDSLTHCNKCTDGAQHTYCMRVRLEKVPPNWTCEECMQNAERRDVLANNNPLVHPPKRIKNKSINSIVYGTFDSHDKMKPVSNKGKSKASLNRNKEKKNQQDESPARASTPMKKKMKKLPTLEEMSQSGVLSQIGLRVVWKRQYPSAPMKP